MAKETYMDIPVVEGYAKQFLQLGGTVNETSKKIDGLMIQVRDAAFIGQVGNAIYTYWTNQLKVKIDKLGAKLEEIGRDINDAIKAYRDGDFSGSQHFVGGGQV